MGQTHSSQIQEYVPFISQILNEESSVTLLSTEINSLTYQDFLISMGEINKLCKKYLDSNGKQLIFAVKKGSDSTVFWKATVEVACIKVDPETQKIDSVRLLQLREFLKVFKTMKCQYSAAEHSVRHDSEIDKSDSPITSDINNDTKSDCSTTECCICMERRPEVLLPCAHSYCLTCIHEWNELHDTCPICRDKLESADDTWVISEVPKAEEICQEIRANLSDLTSNATAQCSH